ATSGPAPNTCAGPTPNAALDPNFTPSLRVSLTKATYSSGEMVTASGFRLANIGSNSGKIELKLSLRQPSGALAALLNVGADGRTELSLGFRSAPRKARASLHTPTEGALRVLKLLGEIRVDHVVQAVLGEGLLLGADFHLEKLLHCPHPLLCGGE